MRFNAVEHRRRQIRLSLGCSLEVLYSYSSITFFSTNVFESWRINDCRELNRRKRLNRSVPRGENIIQTRFL